MAPRQACLGLGALWRISAYTSCAFLLLALTCCENSVRNFSSGVLVICLFCVILNWSPTSAPRPPFRELLLNFTLCATVGTLLLGQIVTATRLFWTCFIISTLGSAVSYFQCLYVVLKNLQKVVMQSTLIISSLITLCTLVYAGASMLLDDNLMIKSSELALVLLAVTLLFWMIGQPGDITQSCGDVMCMQLGGLMLSSSALAADQTLQNLSLACSCCVLTAGLIKFVLEAESHQLKIGLGLQSTSMLLSMISFAVMVKKLTLDINGIPLIIAIILFVVELLILLYLPNYTTLKTESILFAIVGCSQALSAMVSVFVTPSEMTTSTYITIVFISLSQILLCVMQLYTIGSLLSQNHGRAPGDPEVIYMNELTRGGRVPKPVTREPEDSPGNGGEYMNTNGDGGEGDYADAYGGDTSSQDSYQSLQGSNTSLYSVLG